MPFKLWARFLARVLHVLSRGRLHPDTVTIFGLLMHIPIAFLIASGHWAIASFALAFFGLFDKVDGELARLQHRVSSSGGFLDATTDRLKEVIVYIGVTYALATSDHPAMAAWAAAACGASLCVSYVRAKGETIFATEGNKKSYTDLNSQFRDGLMSFEVRTFVLIIGLFVGQLAITVAIIAVLSSITALRRLWGIWRVLRRAKA